MTADFARLLNGIRELLPISLNCKLERHYRWLATVLRRSEHSHRPGAALSGRGGIERAGRD